MIFFIVLGAAFYNGFLALTQVPQERSEWVVALGLSPWSVLVCILVLYLIFGCLMDSLSMILLTIPIFFPIMNRFVINSMDRKTRMIETYKAVLPFVASDIVRVAILVAFPGITLVLLRALY